jgi:hypothetical protein
MTGVCSLRAEKRMGGITLIELLVVFSIVGMLVTLVAPVGYRQMEKARAQEEWMVFRREINELAFLAFSRGYRFDIHMSGSALEWSRQGGELESRTYEYLFFDPEQKISISAKGVASQPQIRVWQAGRERELKLNEWMASR